MGILPNLAASFRKRFAVAGDKAEEVEQPPDTILMRALVQREQFNVNPLSSVAKMTREGNPVTSWRYELPPQPITAMLVSRYKVPGISSRRGQFPYALKAVGPVDAQLILRGGKGMLTDNVVIIP